MSALRFAHPTALPAAAKPAAPKNEFHQPFQRDLGRPDCAAKIYPLLISPKSAPSSRHPASSKRGVRVVTIRGVRGAVDARRSRARGIAGRSQALSWGCERSIRAGRAALLRTAKACGSGTRGWCQAGGGCSKPNRVRSTVNPAATEAKGIRLRGERAISRQTIAQGRPDALRWTCMLVCALLCAIAHETAGAARTRSSLRPLISEGASEQVQLGRVAPRERAGISALSRPDTISADNHPELSPVATCLALRNISALAKAAPTGQKKSWKKKRQRRTI